LQTVHLSSQQVPAKTHESFLCFSIGIFLKLTQMLKVQYYTLVLEILFSIRKWRKNRVTSPACLKMVVKLKIPVSSKALQTKWPTLLCHTRFQNVLFLESGFQTTFGFLLLPLFHRLEVNYWHCTNKLHGLWLSKTYIFFIPCCTFQEQSSNVYAFLRNDTASNNYFYFSCMVIGIWALKQSYTQPPSN